MNDEVYLLAALRIGAGVDPAPLSVSATARAAYGLRLPGALTAHPVPLPCPAGARDAAEPRLHRFAAPGLTIDVELTHVDGRIDVAGQVTPSDDVPGLAQPDPDAPAVPRQVTPEEQAPPPHRPTPVEQAVAASPAGHPYWPERIVSLEHGSRIVIRTLHDRWVRLPTETGYFAATGLPVGWLSVACHRPGRPPVVTRWLHTRD